MRKSVTTRTPGHIEGKADDCRDRQGGKPLRKFFILLPMVLMLSSCRLKKLELLVRYYAKETCSCLFVVEQSREYCQKSLKNRNIPAALVPALTINNNKKTVHAGLFFFYSSAKWIDRYQGCRLLE